MKDLRGDAEKKGKSGDLDIIKLLRFINPLRLIKVYYKDTLLIILLYVLYKIIFYPYDASSMVSKWLSELMRGFM